MDDGDELLPCYYCGNLPTLTETPEGTYTIRCSAGGLDFGLAEKHENPLHLIRLWNEWVSRLAEEE